MTLSKPAITKLASTPPFQEEAHSFPAYTSIPTQPPTHPKKSPSGPRHLFNDLDSDSPFSQSSIRAGHSPSEIPVSRAIQTSDLRAFPALIERSVGTDSNVAATRVWEAGESSPRRPGEGLVKAQSTGFNGTL